ncbi:hypothetical protein RchiOBHm_Chr2g0095701 [Rosa chinensis]|uniref:Uncharacterized protein n=1 Tax=Rosa chinensis TaxID=74649 RepID=A0A2P6RKY3_ROSCH|nr:hypothetical protein RchiOBHm_Chr2g0095701 [Rosa chinensis]
MRLGSVMRVGRRGCEVGHDAAGISHTGPSLQVAWATQAGCEVGFQIRSALEDCKDEAGLWRPICFFLGAALGQWAVGAEGG